VQLTEDLLADEPDLSLSGLLVELPRRADSRHPPVVGGVTLASLHAAEGLEGDAVVLGGLTEGTLPMSHALGSGGGHDDEAAIEEERRLLYVGVTRARVHLALAWARARNAGGRKTRRRSRFMHGLVPEDSPASKVAAPKRERRRPRCRVCGK